MRSDSLAGPEFVGISRGYFTASAFIHHRDGQLLIARSFSSSITFKPDTVLLYLL